MFRELKSVDQKILKLGMADTVRNSFIALPIISLFELFMIIRWFLAGKTMEEPTNAAYMIEYLSLLVASIGVLAAIYPMRKNPDQHYRKINLIQILYAVIIVLWALGITCTGCYAGFMDELVYVTIIIIVPVFCFISPLILLPIQVISAGFILYLASSFPAFQAFAINFSVFTIISIVASWTMYRVRHSAYQRTIKLEEERDQSRYHAYHDALTDLPNRRSYIEDLAQAAAEGLTLAMFDVNGMKPVNDAQGHEAGDELLKGTAECLVKAFSHLGTIYRVGGDEYTGIFYGSNEEVTEALAHFRRIASSWQGKMVKGLSVSVGFASAADHPGVSVDELGTIADDAMYVEKKAYYVSVGKA